MKDRQKGVTLDFAQAGNISAERNLKYSWLLWELDEYSEEFALHWKLQVWDPHY